MPSPQRSNTGSSTHLSPTSANATQPLWPAPRAPLPPHRLAKLANALGVSTPVPATHGTHAFTLAPTSPTIPVSTVSTNFSDAFRRSPTPSFASTQAQHTSAASTSKYLLHVIPPYHLPHDVDDPDLTPAAPAASGYHTQFRRGVLVPVYPSLQAQLGAIAREYALPSTVGMILYLITTLSPSASEEPGPRLSEDIWKHIWSRVVKAEKEEAAAPHPRPLGLGFGIAGRSSPALLQDLAANQAQSQSLHALISPRRVETPQPTISPSPSTSVYSSQSERGAESPESATSVDPSSHSNSLPLPGLESPALIPILAKVEFDIDRQKAGWYDAWLRSRRMNQAKRAESRLGVRSASRAEDESAEEGEEGEGAKKAPMDLRLVEKLERTKGMPNFLLTTETKTDEPEDDVREPDEYQQLEDENIEEELAARLTTEMEADEPEDDVHEPDEYQQLEDEDVEEELATRFDGLKEDGDPLRDVFGEDADTWAEIHASGPRKNSDPNVADLALDAAAISGLPSDLEDGDENKLSEPNDEAEVSELLKRMSKPALSVSIPNSPPTASKRRSSPATAGTIRKHVPPPLHLVPAMPGSDGLPIPEPSPAAPSSAASAQLAYLEGGATPHETEHPINHADEEKHSDESEEVDVQDDDDALLKRVRSPEDEKRGGAIFDDLDLGLEPSFTEDSELDEDDPFDHRRSQLFMAAQLDVIEQNLAQFSPRKLQSVDLTPEDIVHRRKQSSASSMSFRSSIRSLSPRQNNGELSPPSKAPVAGIAWPAIPYSQLNAVEEDPDAPPSPPKFAFNGISTEPPKSPYIRSRPRGGTISDETLARQRALAEDYPALIPPDLMTARNVDSPIIPLSPDPFGRYPSSAEASLLVDDHRNSQALSDGPIPPRSSSAALTIPPDKGSTVGLGAPIAHATDEGRPPSQTPSSRFSLDSVTSEEAAKAVKQPTSSSSIMSVKTIRRLWKKSDKNDKRTSISSVAPVAQPEVGRTSPIPPAPSEVLEAESNNVRRPRAKSVTKPPPAPPLAPLGPPIDLQRIPMARSNQAHSLRFDQESPYPIHPVRNSGIRSPSPPLPMSLSRPPSQQQYRSPSVNQQLLPPPLQPERNSMRKSILKSWKSATGLSNGKASVSRPNSTTPRSSAEQPPETGKRRRPGVLEIATGGLRLSGSGSSMSSATLVDIPASPAIPEHFANQVRSSSSLSQNTYGSSHAGKPSVSSSGSASSPPRVRSSLMGASPPTSGGLSANSRPSLESHDSRSSFDVSQFEMVSPPRGSLSYPYNVMDTSLTSQE